MVRHDAHREVADPSTNCCRPARMWIAGTCGLCKDCADLAGIFYPLVLRVSKWGIAMRRSCDMYALFGLVIAPLVSVMRLGRVFDVDD